MGLPNLLENTTKSGVVMVDPKHLFKGKRITVMGLGLLGRGLNDTRFLVECGAAVTVTDLKTDDQLKSSKDRLQGLPITYKLGGHDPHDFMHADMVLRNADVPSTSPFLKIAEENGVPIEMDESLFCKYFEGLVVGVTGTRGKTTTTTLIHRILSKHYRRVFLSGNIIGCATLPLLSEAGDDDVVTLELSSWQLQGFHKAQMSPNAAIFTNIYPDHLNRYSGMDEYVQDKTAIFRYQKGDDFCLFNNDQNESVAIAEQAKNSKDFFYKSDVPPDWRLHIPGEHNIENVAAALKLSTRLGVPLEVIRKEVESFRGVEHRLQFLGSARGINFINDSTSTTPVAGVAALKAMAGKRTLLIAGGSAKNLDLAPFAQSIADKVAAVALLQGTATDNLRDLISKSGGDGKTKGIFNSMAEALNELLRSARSGDTILLSPGCASFGMFQNEYHRGDTFIKLVHEIIGRDKESSQ